MPDHEKVEEVKEEAKEEVEAPLTPDDVEEAPEGAGDAEAPAATSELLCAACGEPEMDCGTLGINCGCTFKVAPTASPEPAALPKTCILMDCERPAAVPPGLCLECAKTYAVRGLHVATLGPDVPEHDPVNHPSHYTQGDIECIDAIEAAVTNLTGIEAVCTGVAIKYLWRWKLKNGTEDLKKAAWYINHLIKKGGG